MNRHRPKTVALLALALLLLMTVWIMRGLIGEKSPVGFPSPVEGPGLPTDSEKPGPGDASLVAGTATAAGPITLTPNPGSGAATNPSRVDPANFKYPVKTGQLEKLGKFEEREVRVFRHPDGSIRVHRLLETEMKYPLVLVEEVFSGESGTLARQTMSVGDHLMVQFVGGTERPAIEAAVQSAGFTVRKWFQQPGLVLVGIPDADLDSLDESLVRISSLPMIESAERDDLVFANQGALTWIPALIRSPAKRRPKRMDRTKSKVTSNVYHHHCHREVNALPAEFVVEQRKILEKL